MRFISTVLWALAAVLLALFAYRNWADVTLNLWGDIQADVKIPVLLLTFFMVGFLPTWLVMRTKLWGCNRRLEAVERTRASIGVAESTSADPAGPAE